MKIISLLILSCTLSSYSWAEKSFSNFPLPNNSKLFSSNNEPCFGKVCIVNDEHKLILNNRKPTESDRLRHRANDLFSGDDRDYQLGKDDGAPQLQFKYVWE